MLRSYDEGGRNREFDEIAWGPSWLHRTHGGNTRPYTRAGRRCGVRPVAHTGGKCSNSITTIAGDGLRGSTGDDGEAVKAELDRPSGVVESLAGTIYIADSNNNKVRQVVNPTLINEDVISTVAGTSRGFSGDGHLAIHAKLDDPKAVAVDSAGDVFIADTGNNRVREVLANGAIETVAGNGACTSVSSDGNGQLGC